MTNLSANGAGNDRPDPVDGTLAAAARSRSSSTASPSQVARSSTSVNPLKFGEAVGLKPLAPGE